MCAWRLVPHLHNSKVVAHLVQERGSEEKWKHLNRKNTWTHQYIIHLTNSYTYLLEVEVWVTGGPESGGSGVRVGTEEPAHQVAVGGHLSSRRGRRRHRG